MTDLKQIGNYHIDRMLGKGGMGTVYLATDPALQRSTVLKVMHEELASQPDFRERFLQEARAAARLNHPSIIVIYHFEARDEAMFIEMEYVPGGTLGDYMQQQGRIDLRETLFVLTEVADALDYAHANNVIHRDIKPSNILLRRLPKPERGGDPPLRAVVTDFGLAKLLEGGMRTVAGTFMGTLPYMSPEQCLGKPIDGRSDVYSLGVILYQLATAKLPLDIQTPTDAVMKHLHETPALPRMVQPGLPPAVEAIILKAIAKEPADRFITAGEMAEAMRDAAAKLTTELAAEAIAGQSPVSLVTMLDQGSRARSAERTPAAEPASPDLDRDQIQILADDGSVRYVPAQPGTMTVGRASDNVLILEAPSVSHHHARIICDGISYSVADLKSTNGTYLGNARLLEGIVEVWSPDTPLRIGPYVLRLQLTSQPAPGATMAFRAGEAAAVRAAVTLEKQELRVEPGGSVTATAVILNQGVLVDHFRVGIIGVPGEWIAGSLPIVQLMPQASRTVSLTLQPPRSPQSRAGLHPVTIQVTSQSDPNQVAEAKGGLVITGYQQFQVELHPQRQSGVSEGRFKLMVKNLGNADLTLDLSATDPDERCIYTFDARPVTLAPNEERTVELLVHPKAALQGEQPRYHAFTVLVQPTDAAQLTQRVSGEWVHSPPVYDLMAQPVSSEASAGVFSVTVANRGESELTVALEASDPKCVCTCLFTPAQAAVPAGQKQAAQLVVRAETSLPTRRPRSHTITITARPAGAPQASRQINVTWEQPPARAVPPERPAEKKPLEKPIERTPPAAGLADKVTHEQREKPQVRRRMLPAILTFIALLALFIGLGILAVYLLYQMGIQDDTSSLITIACVWGLGLVIAFVRARRVWRRG